MALRRTGLRYLARAVAALSDNTLMMTRTSMLATSSPLPPSADLIKEVARGFKTSVPLRSGLVDILRSEMTWEKENYSQPEELAGGPPAPFVLTESPGDTLMSLARSFGDETVTVEVSVNDQPDEEPYESEEGVLDVDVGVVFTVQITRPNATEALVFECKSDGTYLQVLHIGAEPVDQPPDAETGEDTAYFGPVYEELDDELRLEFDNYLKERGITAELGGYILRLVHDKEQREYVNWLGRIENIVR